MSLYKIHIGADGIVKGFGPNDDVYQPYLEDGDRLVLSSVLPPTPDGELFIALRFARDARLAATDKYLLADYPINEDCLAQIKAYRATLRALPEQPGAPWDGGGEATPWPIKPDV